MYLAECQTAPPITAKLPWAEAVETPDHPSVLASRVVWLGAVASVGCWTLLWLVLV